MTEKTEQTTTAKTETRPEDIIQRTRQGLVHRIEALTKTAAPEQLAYLAKTLDMLPDNVFPDTRNNNHTTQAAITPYRWATFDTYDTHSWSMANNPAMFGGIAPSNWTDGRHTADHIDHKAETLRTLFNRKGYASHNAMVVSEAFQQQSSTNGKVALALFRIRNTNKFNTNWQVSYYYTCCNPWSEIASCAINKNRIWQDSSNTHNGAKEIQISVPANKTSTVIFTSTSGTYRGNTNIYHRRCQLGFYKDSLKLPEGLTFVDDLDTFPGNEELV